MGTWTWLGEAQNFLGMCRAMEHPWDRRERLEWGLLAWGGVEQPNHAGINPTLPGPCWD